MLLGDPLPDLTMPTLDGQPVALRDLIGKPTLLFAWASW
jgi:peroxiredoxin